MVVTELEEKMINILPGMLLLDANTLDMKVGDRVYDKESGRTGTIVDTKETNAGCEEVWIRLDGGDIDVPASDLPECIYLGQTN